MEHKWQENLPQDLKQKISEVDEQIAPRLQQIDEQTLYNQQRVLNLFAENHVAEEDLVGSTGYGYDDIGRDKLEKIYAGYFKTEDALVRPQLTSGTHAITTALFSQLYYGDTLYYMTGMPYDTIQEVIGLVGDNPGSMKKRGINFKCTDLLPNGEVDYEKVEKDLTGDPTIKVVTIQRSLGYSNRDSFTLEKVKKMVETAKRLAPQAVVFIDNCYGEFTETEEATFFGAADLMAGSLYKNAGAGIAKTGAYIVGREKLILDCAAQLIVPGVGKSEGATYGYLRDFYEGFFMAPHTTGEALKGMIFTAALLEKMGMDTAPKWNAPRTDIVQTVTFGKPEPMVQFCAAIQHYSPMNAFVDPEPSYQDGYEDKVIMASGSFTEGSTIELSSDGPLRDPFTLYIQGGLSFQHVKIAIANAVRDTFFQN
ncbi:aminotransferase class I/II-fold pyridoxal phosphate-dependent enzyme [Ligilactobacillus acidipiscis]|uniref:Aluminum resistance protein n=1 Tax=Ligilactobacillus acidipiscis TaxID=89059 RepID=A0A0R2K2S0_9LACO|nr:methionine gamma-lyase family protein [Ligilactobacillus acidipiscis]KRN83707.1 aluminum resistance protein [Ligilactobacillus acidipiscis]